jgi:hypothetical protein
MGHEAGLAGLLQGIEGCVGGFANLQPLGLLDRSCRPEIVLGGTHEVLARAIHEQFISDNPKKEGTPEDKESLKPWDELPEDLKESNRRQADHIWVKLKAGDFQFSDPEVDLLAIREHQRWMEEKKETGWKYAPGINFRQKNRKKISTQSGACRPSYPGWICKSTG